MVYLRMKLYGPDGLLRRSKGSVLDILGGANHLKALRYRRDRIAMAHPHL